MTDMRPVFITKRSINSQIVLFNRVRQEPSEKIRSLPPLRCFPLAVLHPLGYLIERNADSQLGQNVFAPAIASADGGAEGFNDTVDT